MVAEVTRILADFGINIAFMNVSRKMRGFTALLVAETDDPIAREVLEQVQSLRKASPLGFCPVSRRGKWKSPVQLNY